MADGAERQRLEMGSVRRPKAHKGRKFAEALNARGLGVPREGCPNGMNYGTIDCSMKTAISIDEALLREADETARLMGLSRSRLFALAVVDFLQRQRREQML